MRGLVAFRRGALLVTFLVTFGHISGHFGSQEHRLCLRGLVAFRRGALLVTFLVTFGHKNTGSV